MRQPAFALDFDATPTPATGLPPPGALVAVHEVGFGGRQVTGRLLADPDTGELMMQVAGNGTPLAALEEEDGRTTWIAWLADRPDLVAYTVLSGAPATPENFALAADEVEEAPEGLPPAPPPPPPAQEVARPRRRRREVAPLTEEELTAEARGVSGHVGAARSAPSVAQEAPAPTEWASAPDDLATRALRAQKGFAAADAREEAAQRAYHQAQAAYVRAADGSAEEAKALAVVRERGAELAAAAEAARQARRAVMAQALGGVGAGVPKWVLPVAVAAVFLILGPIAGLLAGAIVVSPFKALLTGK